MKHILANILVGLLVLSGLSLLLYPLVSNQWNTYRQNQLIVQYDENVRNSENQFDYEAEWERAHAYNDALLPMVLPDSFAIAEHQDEPDEEYMACLNVLGDGMMGKIIIPKIAVEIPIYHTTMPEVLDRYVGHLEGSSLPAGGKNTHAVLSAHRGLPSATLFTDLNLMAEGDHFLLYILDDILCYEVDQILIVEPEDTESLAVQKGEDLVTLLTCTPYGVNTQRLLVQGHRVPYEPEVLVEEEQQQETSIYTNYLFWVVVGLAITLVVVLVMAFTVARTGKGK